MRKTTARETAIPAYCAGVSPKYLASLMRRKSRKKRAEEVVLGLREIRDHGPSTFPTTTT
jgi:hypothetical protein